MVDWADTQAFFKEHWRPILIISLVVVAIIIGISLTLVFVLKRKPIPSVSIPPNNYPSDINGDPPQGSDKFAYPQIITNPIPSTDYFAQHMFVHDAGYIAVTVQKTPAYQSMLMYYTNSAGEIQGPQEISLSFLTTGYVVCNGMFAPIFNVSGEVFYLFFSVGTSSASNGNVYPRYVMCLSLDTNTTTNVWKLADINTQYYAMLGSTKALCLPSTSFTYDATIPWYGTFGAKIQVVLDDNEAITKQSLYISGSEYDANRPGGNLYWYILQNNSQSPSILLVYTIQDAKLFLMKAQTSCPNGCNGCSTFNNKDEANCTNGFGSDFYVTSGNKSSNILVVANSTCQDNCILTNSNQPCAPKGYVQGYILNSTGGTQAWVQPQDGSNAYLYRYIGVLGDANLINPSTPGGFAVSVSVVEDKIIIGQAQPNAAGEGTFLVYNWTQSPFQNSQLTPLSVLNPSDGASAPFYQTNMLTAMIRYNMGVQAIDDGSSQILATSWYQPGPADVISIQDPDISGQPFASFHTIQSFGSGFSSNYTTAATISRTGFAQNTQTWLSRTGASVRLATNDPFHSSNAGRLIVFTRKRQG